MLALTPAAQAAVKQSSNPTWRRILPSRLEVFEPSDEPLGIPSRDLMQDIKAELDTSAGKTEAPDAAPAIRDSGDEAVPMREQE